MFRMIRFNRICSGVCLGTILLATVAFAQVIPLANADFERADLQRNHPAFWHAYFWSQAEKLPSAIRWVDDVRSHGKASCRIDSATQGAHGIISQRVPIPKQKSYLQCSIKVKTSPDYAGNRPWLFLSWHDERGKFLNKTEIKQVVEKTGNFQTMAVCIPRDQIPDGSTQLAVNLASLRTGSKTPSGCVYFDDVQLQVTDKPLDAESQNLNALLFGKHVKPQSPLSWWQLGQTVCYRIDPGMVPDALTAWRGTIEDTDGKQVDQVTLSRQQLIQDGWTWQPNRPGWYAVKFAWQSRTDQTWQPITRQYNMQSRGKPHTFTVDQWSFAVAATPTLPMAQRGDWFGMSIQSNNVDVAIADLMGMGFARIHAIGWGAQFANESLGVELKPGQYNWQRYDQLIDRLDTLGFDIIGNILYTPRWASPYPERDNIHICVREFSVYAPKDMQTWHDFVAACVQRYGSKIDTWELWNEPNMPNASVFWKDTPENYLRLLKSGYEAVKRYQPDSKVCIGGLGPRSSYFSFYNHLLKLGGAKYFDVLALHGKDITPQPFYAIDQAWEIPNKPWISTEWHAMLYSGRSSEALPSEKQMTRRMIMDLLQQLKAGAEQVTFFCGTGSIDREVMPFARKNRWASHLSGLFRTRPSHEPRFAAVVLQHLQQAIPAKPQYRGCYQFQSDQQAAWFGQGDDSLLILWSNADQSQPVDPRIANLMTPKTVLTQWDGRRVGMVDGTWSVKPQTMYLLKHINEKVAARLPVSDDVPVNPREVRVQLQQEVVATFKQGPLFASVTSPVSPHVDWQSSSMQYVPLDGKPQPAGFNAKFAVGMTTEYLDIAVQVHDSQSATVPLKKGLWNGDSVQFALDPDGSALAGNQVEFIAADVESRPILLKTIAPYIGGDLPDRYTPAKLPVKHAQVAVDRSRPGQWVYKIRIDASELYPFVLTPDKALRFSFLVNNNDGKERAGYLHWASGIGQDKNPALYGTLEPVPPQQ